MTTIINLESYKVKDFFIAAHIFRWSQLLDIFRPFFEREKCSVNSWQIESNYDITITITVLPSRVKRVSLAFCTSLIDYLYPDSSGQRLSILTSNGSQICKNRIRGNTLIKELIVCPAKQRLVAW